jgi:hypothetical protein
MNEIKHPVIISAIRQTQQRLFSLCIFPLVLLFGLISLEARQSAPAWIYNPAKAAMFSRNCPSFEQQRERGGVFVLCLRQNFRSGISMKLKMSYKLMTIYPSLQTRGSGRGVNYKSTSALR